MWELFVQSGPVGKQFYLLQLYTLHVDLEICIYIFYILKRYLKYIKQISILLQLFKAVNGYV